MLHRTYLDYNATTPIKPVVAEVMRHLPLLPYNASSLHSYGRQARRLVEEARKRILDALDLSGNEQYLCVFTSSGTEANNMALQRRNLLASAIEHASVLKCAHESLKIIPVTEKGIVDLKALEKLLVEADSGTCVSVMLANNETGIIQPVKEVAELAHRYGAIVHCDAVQCFGKIPVRPADLGVDMLTISAHKCGGPLGAAALIHRQTLPLIPMIRGGGQERGSRSGTENVPAIAGFGVAAASLGYDVERVEAMRNKLENLLSGAEIVGRDVPRLPNTSCILMPEVHGEIQLIDFDLNGIAVSSGSACSSGKVTVSHVLLAMGIPESKASCAIRVSLGEDTTEDDIARFATVWNQLYVRSHNVADA